MDATSGGLMTRPQKVALTPTPPFSSSSTTLVPDEAALQSLSPDAPFDSVDAVFALIESAISTGDDCVIVAPTSVKQYNALCRDREARGRKFRLFYLGTQAPFLIVTVPTGAHEVMHNHIYTQLMIQTAQMGLGMSGFSTAAETCAGPSSSHGEADGNFLPFPARAGGWPTIVFEAGYSQSEASLRAKMNWWFWASNHDVKIVVLAKAFPHTNEKRLKIEQWQERPVEAVRPGATATRHSTATVGAALQPTCLQTINVSWAGVVPFDKTTAAQVADRQQYNVVRAPLVLEFGLAFLRQAVGPREHDFVFPAEFFQFYAALVWSRTRRRRPLI